MAGTARPHPTILTSYDQHSYTWLLTQSAMTNLQMCEMGGSIQKTLWQLCQLVFEETPGELRDKMGVWGCALWMFTQIRLSASGMIMIYRTQNTRCSVKQSYYHISVLSKCPWVLGNHWPTGEKFVCTCICVQHIQVQLCTHNKISFKVGQHVTIAQ